MICLGSIEDFVGVLALLILTSLIQRSSLISMLILFMKLFSLVLLLKLLANGDFLVGSQLILDNWQLESRCFTRPTSAPLDLVIIMNLAVRDQYKALSSRCYSDYINSIIQQFRLMFNLSGQL